MRELTFLDTLSDDMHGRAVVTLSWCLVQEDGVVLDIKPEGTAATAVLVAAGLLVLNGREKPSLVYSFSIAPHVDIEALRVYVALALNPAGDDR